MVERDGDRDDMTHVAREFDTRIGQMHVNQLNGARSPRVVLYSHDTLGLGHLRRNLLVAQSLASSPLQSTNLLITGAHEANFFILPDGVDCLTLPRLQKNNNGDYTAGQLDISLRELARLRTNSIRVAVENFQPDLVIVDKVPIGAFGELLPALEAIEAEGRAKCVFGIRDVLDDRQTVKQECLCEENLRAIDRFYDSVWVYGDASIYDPVAEYDFPPSIRAKTYFTGYLDQSGRLDLVDHKLPNFFYNRSRDVSLAVCLLGGGQDGAAIADVFAAAIPSESMHGVIVAGPFMPVASLESLRRKASRAPHLTVLEFSPEADLLIREADHVVAMAGYNTVCSILSFDKRALLIPRTSPRREQLIRAERLTAHGIADVLLAEQLSVDRMRRWLSAPIPQRSPARKTVDLNGLIRVSQLATDMLQSESPSTAPRSVVPHHPIPNMAVER